MIMMMLVICPYVKDAIMMIDDKGDYSKDDGGNGGKSYRSDCMWMKA